MPDAALGADAERAGGDDVRLAEDVQQRTRDVAPQLDPRVEQHDGLARRRLEGAVRGLGPALGRVDRQDADAAVPARRQAQGDFLVAGVVGEQGLEVVGCRVRQHAVQPALGVGRPAVHEREHRDCPGRGRRLRLVELAPHGAVDHLPPTLAQAVANGVGAREVPRQSQPCPLGEQLFRSLRVDAMLAR